MKIVVIMPMASGKYEDDTTQHCRALTRYGGHTIIYAEKDEENPPGVIIDKKYENKMDDVDLIWCPYEDLLPNAFILKKELNKPIVGHFEIALSGRFLQDITDVYWYENTDPPTEEDFGTFGHTFYINYRNYLNLYRFCDVKTVVGQFHKMRGEKIIGRPLGETFIKPYPIDTELYDKYKKEGVEEKYQVCCIARLIIYKRLFHTLKALSLLKNPPKLIVAGVADDRVNYDGMLKDQAKELGVDVEFRGHITDEEKVHLIQESMFTFSHYGWIPPTEAAYLKKPCVCYYEPDTHERLKDIPYYVESNNVEALADAIEYLSKNKDVRETVGLSAYNKLMNGECHTHPLEEDSKQLTKIFEKALQPRVFSKTTVHDYKPKKDKK